MSDQEALDALRSMQAKVREDKKFTRHEQDALVEAIGVFKDAAEFEASMDGLVNAIASKTGAERKAPPIFKGKGGVQ